jgi:hypothetical protein
MTTCARRYLPLAFLVLASFGFGVAERSAIAQTDNWQYVPELGGYLDWDTGLVWGEQRGISTWDGAVAYTDRLRTNTGFPWRLPTVAECQLAAANGICEAIPSTAQGRSCWTADAKNKGGARTAHYAIVFLRLPDFAYLYGNGSLIDSIAVYQAFTP